MSPINRSSTTYVYGIIFPVLLSTLIPQLFSLFDLFLVQQHMKLYQQDTVKEEQRTVINSYITLYVWQIGSLGAVLVTLFNNYAIFNIFKSASVFAYSNFIQTIILLIVFILFVCLVSRRVTRKKRFISFNELSFNEASKETGRTKISTDSEDEEMELMVKKKRQNNF